MKPTRFHSTDRAANEQELRSARRFVLACDGPGIVEGARRLGVSPGYLSQLLRGERNRRLLLSELRRLRAARIPVAEAPAPAAPAGPATRRREVAI
jgi:transcriptional regulator with XRE-family HTH domain